MASTTVKVEGLRELGEAMRSLGRDIALRVSGQATAAGAAPIKKRAIHNVETSPSVDTGSLRDAIIVKKLPRSQTDLTSEHIVTVRGRGKKHTNTKRKQSIAPHAHLVEFGTVNMPAEPFLQPAFNTEKNSALDAIAKKLKQRIDAVRPK